MKNVPILFVLFLISLTTLCGQSEYRPTAMENAKWIIQDSETPHYPYAHFVRAIEGDTIINDTTYKKLYQYVINYVEEQFGPPFEPPYRIFPDRELIVLLRDDVENRRVYGRSTDYALGTADFTEDVLFHDYSLGVNDTLTGYYFGDIPLGSVVDDTGSALVFGETFRFQQVLSDRYYEGIGSVALGPTSGDYHSVLNCCRWRLIDYCVGDNAFCSIVSPVTDLTRGSKITTYPNPFADRITIEATGEVATRPIKATLRTLTGQIIRQAQLTGEYRWSNLNLAPGVYFLTYTVDGATFTSKIVRR